jgi:hypothetical protein
MILGTLSAGKIQNALRKILGKVEPGHFNGLEVTGIVVKHFLGMPYAIVTAHCRHIQPSCYLDSSETRRMCQPNVEPLRV